MGDATRAALLAVMTAAVTFAIHLAILQVWAGPFEIAWEWNQVTFFVLPTIMAMVLAGTLSDIGDERAGRWLRERDVPDGPHARSYVRAWVRLTRTCRGVGFFGVALLPGVAAWATNFGLPPDSLVQQRLVGVASSGIPGLQGWSPAIVGYAVGALVGEALRHRPRGQDGSIAVRADLRPRVPAAYLQPLARWGPRALAAAALVVAATTPLVDLEAAAGPSGVVLAMVAASTLVVTEAVRWAVVRHRQRAAGPGTIALDDAARATTIHAVSGSAIAIIGQALGSHLGNASVDLEGVLRWLALGGSSIGLVSLGVWLGYGVGLAWVVQRGPHATPRTTAHDA